LNRNQWHIRILTTILKISEEQHDGKNLYIGRQQFDMTPEMVQEYGIAVVASYVRMDDKDFLDYPDLKQVIIRLFPPRAETPQTAAANPQDYETFFQQCLLGTTRWFISRRVRHVECLTSGHRGQRHGDVYVVDSKSISSGSTLLAMEAYGKRSP
jgi:fatty acid-binding protein DegV